MDRAERCSNHFYLTDILEFFTRPKRVKTSVLTNLYQNKDLTSSQIADKIGVSKQTVLNRLRKAGIKNSSNKGRSPKNYTHPNPPYGYKVRNQRLCPNSKEIRVIRLIVGAIEQQGLTLSATARLLNEKGYLNRKRCQWGHFSICKIYKRWEGKV